MLYFGKKEDEIMTLNEYIQVKPEDILKRERLEEQSQEQSSSEEDSSEDEDLQQEMEKNKKDSETNQNIVNVIEQKEYECWSDEKFKSFLDQNLSSFE